MIAPLPLLANALWVLALALALAALSHASFTASHKHTRLRLTLSLPPYPLLLSLAGLLFSLGLSLTSTRWFEVAAWALLALLFLILIAARLVSRFK